MSDLFESPGSRNEAILQNMLGANNPLEPPRSRIEALLQQLLAEIGSGGGGKTLAQMGFYFHSLTRNTAAPSRLYFAIPSSGLPEGVSIEEYAPDAGAIIGASVGFDVPSGSTLAFRVGASGFSADFPIRYSGLTRWDSSVMPNGSWLLLQFDGSAFQVVSVVRDPVTVPTKLSDLENDLDLSGIKIIDATAMATSLQGLLSLVKSGITGASGQKTVLFTSNLFAQFVYEVFGAFSSDKLPVFFLGLGFYLPVVDTGNDGNDNGWFTVRMNETETVGTTVTGYTHQITISMVGVVIQTTKTAIEKQPLPSA